MTIKTKTTGVIPVLASDTVILTVLGKAGVSAFNVHNTTATDKTVTFYSSPDITSASGDRVGQIVLALNESADVNEIVGQTYNDSQRIIAVASATGVNASLTYDEFSGSDI